MSHDLGQPMPNKTLSLSQDQHRPISQGRDRRLIGQRTFAWSVVVMAAVMVAGPSAYAHPPTIVDGSAEKATAEELVDFRKRLAAAVKAKNSAALKGMYAKTFQHTDPSGKIDTRDMRIAALLAGNPSIETATAEDLVISVHAGGWAAVAFGTSPITSPVDSNVDTVRWTAMYVRTEQSWHLVASHATRGNEATKSEAKK